ncbi:hypothetical protein DFJ43DRAFT_1068246 [Lentinula guzmanii]|uniref:Uncharacterized protein n=1 Tax=Lentinula guzmanii TaxID=2804957 RepID=A0AA38N1S3_9AGAR|nr:hypothetical protein DFJ43DRAFT_1068246 [Lentinula guzmanii]
MFLWWAIAQERLYLPFQIIDGKSSDKFRSALFLGTCQSFLSSLSALIYILLRKKKLETLIQALISRQELRRGHHSCYLERKSTYHTPMV